VPKGAKLLRLLSSLVPYEANVVTRTLSYLATAAGVFAGSVKPGDHAAADTCQRATAARRASALRRYACGSPPIVRRGAASEPNIG